ncbi:phosphatase PAP2 family protein [Arthrobacter sp. Sa2BUA2]|uniref:Phosphatase PAP2 family protein n=1 Tax=Arthrobacter pullicola TaxID=2762224 RepID=A0ABR8YDQ4_9MICC|nr:phosphatase PAP2 family protein [Arthrobacter pullicola]MBD8042351.1 phosphatase PAP2 family protein [Arthrobacter pullicola]
MTEAVRNQLQRLLASASGLLGRHAVLVLTLVAGLVPALLLTLAAAGVYDSVVEEDGVAGLDQPVLDAAIAARSPALDTAVTGLTNLGGTVGLPLIAGAAVVALCWWKRTWTPLVLVATAAAGSLLITVVGKSVVGRHRPPLEDAVPPYEYSASFPSGHSLNSLAVIGTLAYLLVLYLHSRLARAAAITGAVLFIAAVGLSRVYLGHHWLTDVLVAWTIGLAWLAIVITVHQVLHRRNTRSSAGSGAGSSAGPAADDPDRG